MLAQIVSLIMDNMEAAVSKNELRHGVKGKNQAFSGGPSMFPGAALALPTATWCQMTANATPALPCFQDALTNSLASLIHQDIHKQATLAPSSIKSSVLQPAYNSAQPFPLLFGS